MQSGSLKQNLGDVRKKNSQRMVMPYGGEERERERERENIHPYRQTNILADIHTWLHACIHTNRQTYKHARVQQKRRRTRTLNMKKTRFASPGNGCLKQIIFSSLKFTLLFST